MSLHSTDLFEIERRVVVITGGTRGIGLMIALTFLSNGCTVYVNSRKKSACEEAEKKLNASKDPKWGKAYAIDADLGDEKGCLKFCDAVKQREKVVDILVRKIDLK
jgi:NAD(P)-dependent dehydrogenase (short-subunit alcohol dehydrogenase family)